MNGKLSHHSYARAGAGRWLRLTGSLTMLLAGALLLPGIASAQAPPRFSLPLGGHSFLSQTGDGVGIVGALNVEEFSNQDGQLVATGIVQADLLDPAVNPSVLSSDLQATLTPDGAELTLPVSIETATCKDFTMEVGPVPGLVDPILISVGKGKDVAAGTLTKKQRAVWCEMAKAAKKNQTDRLVMLLNQSEGVGGGNLQSCGFIEAIKCAFAATTCGGACITGPPACIACLASIGYLGCKDCLGV